MHVLYNTHVTRVILEPRTPSEDDKDSWTAIGVEASTLNPPTSNPHQADGTVPSLARTAKIIKARHEVIVSGGAYNSPVILMQSGLGPKEHLEEKGIDCKVDIPGVGSSLEDHLLVFNFYQLNSNLT